MQDVVLRRKAYSALALTIKHLHLRLLLHDSPLPCVLESTIPFTFTGAARDVFLNGNSARVTLVSVSVDGRTLLPHEYEKTLLGLQLPHTLFQPNADSAHEIKTHGHSLGREQSQTLPSI